MELDSWNAPIGADCAQVGEIYKVRFVLPLDVEVNGEKYGLQVTVTGIGSGLSENAFEYIPLPKQSNED